MKSHANDSLIKFKSNRVWGRWHITAGRFQELRFKQETRSFQTAEKPPSADCFWIWPVSGCSVPSSVSASLGWVWSWPRPAPAGRCWPRRTRRKPRPPAAWWRTWQTQTPLSILLRWTFPLHFGAVPAVVLADEAPVQLVHHGAQHGAGVVGEVQISDLHHRNRDDGERLLVFFGWAGSQLQEEFQ